jgi:chromate reductase, NAD(P)H dehydrogenase (quinone)
MPSLLEIVAIAGSLRAASYNKGLLRAAAEIAPRDVAVEILDLAALPLYSQDLDLITRILKVPPFLRR